MSCFKKNVKRFWFIGIALCLLLALAPRAIAAESLASGVDFLAQDASAFLADVSNGKFAILQFVEEPDNPMLPLSQPAETSGLGTQLAQALTSSLQKVGKQAINRNQLCTILRTNNFKIEDLGNRNKVNRLFNQDLHALIYGRMRRGNDGTITIGIEAVKKGANNEIVFSPQGRSIVVAMNGNMYALCAMNGTLQVNPGIPVQVVASGQAVGVSPMLIAAPLQPQVAAPQQVQPYNIEVLMDGQPLPCYRSYKGDYFVPSSRGKEYQIRLTNNTSGRTAVALLVDGLGVIGGNRALPVIEQNFSLNTMPEVDVPGDVYKFVLLPNSNIVVSGWQISSSLARKFVFSKAEESRAASMDFWDYIGSISASFYPEMTAAATAQATQITRGLTEAAAPAEGGAKGMDGTQTGDAYRNPTEMVNLVYSADPAAVLGVFYDSPAAIAQAGMVQVK